jgi:hypothetical protein
MSRAHLKKALPKRYLHWRSGSPSLAVHPQVAHPDYPSRFRSNSRQSTRNNKHSHYFLLLSQDHPHTPMDHQTSGSSPRSLPLQGVQVLPPSLKLRREPRRAQSLWEQSKRRRVWIQLLQRPHARGVLAVPIWVQMSGHVSGRTIMSVHHFRFLVQSCC